MTERNRNTAQGEEDFASLWTEMESAYDYITPMRGDVRRGTILSVRPDEIIIDIGAKRDAIVSPREVQQLSPKEREALKVGQTVYVYVMHANDREDELVVSLRLAKEYEDWLRAQELLESGEIIRAKITGYNKGGLLCAVGTLQGFVPASQIITHAPRTTEGEAEESWADLVGQELPLKVIEVNRRRRRLVLSERAARREWRAQQREELWATLREGEIRTGTVSSLRDFGAFVDLGGVDGLIHISELSWERTKHPKEVLRVGQTVEVMVLRVDREAEKIALSLKRTRPDPWESVAARYRPGQLVQGTVSHLVKFGAFVELEPGVEGLVHASELAEGDFGDPSNVVTEGEELTFLVLAVEPEKHRISLSLRQVPPEANAKGSSAKA
jgi:small subunit ribosomal protein S1